jgi:dipeptidyl aminopeptidase/acylaminoacyl peptidase
VILIGARVYPDVRQLHRAGVERIVLAAGVRDLTYPHLVEQARRLRRQGTEVRFVSLGDTGHWFPDDLTPRMSEILDWVDE